MGLTSLFHAYRRVPIGDCPRGPGYTGLEYVIVLSMVRSMVVPGQSGQK